MPVLVLVKSVSDTLPDCQTRFASLVRAEPVICHGPENVPASRLVSG